jgi:membrane fusion protein (multidrug efflux system)
MSSAVAGGQAGAKTQFPAKRLLIMGAGFAALIAVAAYAIQYEMVGQYFETTDDAYAGGDVTDLAPKISGLIANIAVSDNQTVRAGDLLVKIDDRDFRIAVDKAQAAEASAQARIKNLAASRVLQLALIPEAQADIAASRAQIVLARENQDRYARLAASNAGTRQDAQTAEAALQQALAAGDKAAAELAAAIGGDRCAARTSTSRSGQRASRSGRRPAQSQLHRNPRAV